MKNLTILLLLILFSSCSANWHLKRAKRHELIALSKGAEIRPDTVYKEVPVILKETRVDSIIHTLPGDTVVLQKDRLKIVYVRLPGDSVYIEGACEADTVKIRVPVTVTKVIYPPDKGLKWWAFLLIGAGAMLVLYFIIRK
jgi:hypothetical protein